MRFNNIMPKFTAYLLHLTRIRTYNYSINFYEKDPIIYESAYGIDVIDVMRGVF